MTNVVITSNDLGTARVVKDLEATKQLAERNAELAVSQVHFSLQLVASCRLSTLLPQIKITMCSCCVRPCHRSDFAVAHVFYANRKLIC